MQRRGGDAVEYRLRARCAQRFLARVAAAYAAGGHPGGSGGLDVGDVVAGVDGLARRDAEPLAGEQQALGRGLGQPHVLAPDEHAEARGDALALEDRAQNLARVGADDAREQAGAIERVQRLAHAGSRLVAAIPPASERSRIAAAPRCAVSRAASGSTPDVAICA